MYTWINKIVNHGEFWPLKSGVLYLCIYVSKYGTFTPRSSNKLDRIEEKNKRNRNKVEPPATEHSITTQIKYDIDVGLRTVPRKKQTVNNTGEEWSFAP